MVARLVFSGSGAGGGRCLLENCEYPQGGLEGRFMKQCDDVEGFVLRIVGCQQRSGASYPAKSRDLQSETLGAMRIVNCVGSMNETEVHVSLRRGRFVEFNF